MATGDLFQEVRTPGARARSLGLQNVARIFDVQSKLYLEVNYSYEYLLVFLIIPHIHIYQEHWRIGERMVLWSSMEI